MATVVSFVLKDWTTLVHHIERLQTSESSQYNVGCLCLLQLARLKCEKKLCSLKRSFCNYTDLPEVPFKDFLTITIPVTDDGLKSEQELLSVSAVDGDFCGQSSDSDSEDGKFCYCSLIPRLHFTLIILCREQSAPPQPSIEHPITPPTRFPVPTVSACARSPAASTPPIRLSATLSSELPPIPPQATTSTPVLPFTSPLAAASIHSPSPHYTSCLYVHIM